MKQTKKTEDILAGLELAVCEIIKPENLNVWISVREHSITGILKSCDVDFNYSSAFLEELRNVGLIETTSSGCGLRYMVRTLEIPDVKFLARKIYDNYKDRTRKGKVSDGYAVSPSGDLKPIQYRPQTTKGGPVRVIPKEVANLGDIGYIIKDNEIKEVIVTGISYATIEHRSVVYELESCRQENEAVYYQTFTDVPRALFYRSVEDAIQHIKVRKYIKRKPTTDIKQ